MQKHQDSNGKILHGQKIKKNQAKLFFYLQPNYLKEYTIHNTTYTTDNTILYHVLFFTQNEERKKEKKNTLTEILTTFVLVQAKLS